MYTLNMLFITIGLGNPGEEYKNTRHNAGMLAVDAISEYFQTDEWKFDKKQNALISKGIVGKEKMLLIKPQTYMNKSGNSVKDLITSEKKAQNLMVVHDDLDLPLGTLKIVFNRGSGGHKGIESIVRAIKTEAFIRIKVGISPTTPSGKLKKPKGADAVEKHILKEFKKEELDLLKKVNKKICAAIEVIVNESLQKAMTEYNK
jgi:peptidyl-tRNA hydrolase, PTH1 family